MAERVVIFITQPKAMPWLKRIWSRIAAKRKQDLSEMVIQVMNEHLRAEDAELERKLASLEEVKKP